MSATPDSTLNDHHQAIADLKRQLAESNAERDHLRAERDEALEQQIATTEVLQVINSSPGDLASVFDAMLDKATLLTEAAFGILWTYDGELFHARAFYNVPPPFAKFLHDPQKASPTTVLGRIVAGEDLVHTVDLMATEPYEHGDPARRALVDLGGARSHLAAALRKGDVLLGDISIYRQEVRPFTDKQIALLENFAAQAVIAIENARLITETREALEQQTATAEVLGVINSSPGDLAPVFDAMLEKAMRLCGAEFGEFFITEGEELRAIAVRGVPEAFAEFRHRNPAPPIPGSITARILTGEPVIHVADVKDDDLYRRGDLHRRALVDLGGARTFLSVTLIKGSGGARVN
jgi:transcriptional regulator with GAF, ATPase, and Fis domain